MSDDLWAVSAYFNPSGARSRRRNHRCMHEHLPLPLLTVEWSPDGCFELDPASDAERVVRVTGGDLLWQKERLLDIGLAALPPEVDAVAWVDANFVAVHDDWPGALRSVLQRHPVAQGFSRLHYLDPQETADLACGAAPSDLLAALDRSRATPGSARLARDDGVEALVAADVAGHASLDIPVEARRLPRNPGVAWVARREELERVGGLYDRAVAGSGDWLFLLGALGAAETWLERMRPLGYRYLDCGSYRRWAAGAAGVLGGDVGAVDADVLHLYHGRLADRRYKRRHAEIDALGIDLDADLHLTDTGVWALRDPRPELTAHLAAYFAARDEDRDLR